MSDKKASLIGDLAAKIGNGFWRHRMSADTVDHEDETAGNVPEWLNEMMLKFNAGVGHLIILWGNIYDYQRNLKGEYVPLNQFLKKIFDQRDLVMFYSLSVGLQFTKPNMEAKFRSRYLGADAAEDASGDMSATDAAAKELAQNESLSELIGNTPAQVLKFLERPLTDSDDKSPECALIIEHADNIVPNSIGGQNGGDRVSAEMLERWANDDRINRSGNIIVLVTPSLAGLNECLRSTQSGAITIRIPKPDENLRTARWTYLFDKNGVKFADGLTPEFLGRITNGLSLKQIDSIYLLARQSCVPVTLALINKKSRRYCKANSATG